MAIVAVFPLALVRVALDSVRNTSTRVTRDIVNPVMYGNMRGNLPIIGNASVTRRTGSASKQITGCWLNSKHEVVNCLTVDCRRF